ncbi:MAG: hypothetical protein JSW61_06445 [Candidatus Thorarchaeota archaeon]|nr:MAG: hypothetical protein JSW61_06445 [Candidatus Thorarchaeota archaeon]
MIEFEFPGSDLVAVMPYVLPLLFIGALLILYQRFMDRTERKRNAILGGGIVCVLFSIGLIAYAGFGSGWWRADQQSFGSWWEFMAVIQWLTDTLFDSVYVGTIYVFAMLFIVAIIGRSIIAPPNPDFVKLNDELKEARSVAEGAGARIQEAEVENKRLNEFISEKESALGELQTQVDSLQERIAVLQSQLAEPTAVPTDATREEELLTVISQKDQTITSLQAEIATLKQSAETGVVVSAVGVSEDVARLQSLIAEKDEKLDEYGRRAETASEVSDSVISDLVELISLVEGSSLEVPAKKALTGLIEGLGRAIGRVAGPPDQRTKEDPKIEMIGAVMMVHEMVDGIKRLARGS